MSVPNINEAMRLLQKQLNQIAVNMKEDKVTPEGIQEVLSLLRATADLTSSSLDSRSIKKENGFLELVENIRRSPNFAQALGIYQLEFSGLLARIEKIFREAEGTKPVSRVDMDRLER